MLEMSRFIGITNLLIVGEAPTPNESSSKEKEHIVGGMSMWEEAIRLLIMTRSGFIGGGNTIGCNAGCPHVTSSFPSWKRSRVKRMLKEKLALRGVLYVRTMHRYVRRRVRFLNDDS